jgi:hypothetical protein
MFMFKPREVKIKVHDGVEIAVALYTPEGHCYNPDKIGADTIHHSRAHPSALVLPVTEQ